MNCEDFDMLMADALGDELSPDDRPSFEAHLASCDRCRGEYESASDVIASLRSIPGPERVVVRREGDRLIIQDRVVHVSSTAIQEAKTLRQRSARWSPFARPTVGGVMRYAASLLLAFTSGYGLHAGLIVFGSPDGGVVTTIVADGSAHAIESASLEGAMRKTHTRKPTRSGLAKCLIAMSPTKR